MQETAHELHTQCYFLCYTCQNQHESASGMWKHLKFIRNEYFLSITVMSGSSLFFPYHFDNQLVHKSFLKTLFWGNNVQQLQLCTERQKVSLKTSAIVDQFLNNSIH